MDYLSQLKIPTLIESFKRESTRPTIHEGLRTQLWNIGVAQGFTPLAEFKVDINTPSYVRKTRRGKLDLVWVKDGAIHSAFEIDFSWKKKSLLKLSTVDAKNRVFVVVSRTPQKIDVPNNIIVKQINRNWREFYN